MRIEELSIGENPPEDVNVIIEVPVGGQPIDQRRAGHRHGGGLWPKSWCGGCYSCLGRVLCLCADPDAITVFS